MQSNRRNIVALHVAGDLLERGFDRFAVGNDESLDDKQDDHDKERPGQSVEHLFPAGHHPGDSDGDAQHHAEQGNGNWALEKPIHRRPGGEEVVNVSCRLVRQ